MIYLDYAASTPICPQAYEVLVKSHQDDFANPSSAHKFGKKLADDIEQCRQYFLQLTSTADDYNFIFTSSATESNNTIIKGLKLLPGDTIFISSADHPSVTAPASVLGSSGVTVEEIPTNNDGTIDCKGLLKAVNPQVKLVVLTRVNNQSGHIHPVEIIGKAIKQKFPKIHLHIDDAQGFTKHPLNMNAQIFDSLSVSSHKVYGPKGIAGLYLKKDATIKPLLDGGGQEFMLRSSTQAAPLIKAFTKACQVCIKDQSTNLELASHLNSIARSGLQQKIPSIKFLFGLETTSAYILTFILPGVSSDIILRHLEQIEIFISSTSACSSRVKGQNSVFSALKIPTKNHKEVLRISLGTMTSKKEIDCLIDNLCDIYSELQYLMKR
ncbi:MAG: cysteine desulfurase [Bacteriovoracaceae bacterium]|nr:cysteine desulfurase [Bacteriovoracaceae bacterium]